MGQASRALAVRFRSRTTTTATTAAAATTTTAAAVSATAAAARRPVRQEVGRDGDIHIVERVSFRSLPFFFFGSRFPDFENEGEY